MSVIMTLRFTGDPAKLEQVAAEQADVLQASRRGRRRRE